MTASGKIRGAILISGRGSNMRALLEAARGPDYPIRFCAVISNVADAPGLGLAERLGYPAMLVDGAGRGRAAFETDLTERLTSLGVDLICLAGFMRVLSAGFVASRPRSVINIHPSLLPHFRGLGAQAQALAAGVHESGCTVHWVTADLDGGPIIARARVPVQPGDTTASLSARILKAEHLLYPAAARAAAAAIRTRVAA